MGIIHIVHTPMGGGEGSRQINTIAYEEEGGFQSCVRTQKKVFTTKSQNFPFFTKEAIKLPFIIVYRKVQPVLSYK